MSAENDAKPGRRVKKSAPRTGKPLPTGISLRNDKYRVRVSWQMRQLEIGMFDNLRIAEAALYKAQLEIVNETFIPPAVRRKQMKARLAEEHAKHVTVEQWANTWLANLQNADPPKSAGTIASYRSTLRVHILPLLGNLRLVDVTAQHIDDVLALARQRGLGAARNAARTVQSLFHSAVAAEIGGLTKVPKKITVSRPTSQKTFSDTRKLATAAEEATFEQAMPNNLALTVPLAIHLSLRLGEVLGLQRGDFHNLEDPDRATVRISRQWHSKSSPPAYAPPKSGSARDRAVAAALVPKITAHLEKYCGPEPTAPLFPSAKDPSKPISQSTFDRIWRKAREQVRPGFLFHSLRHTGASEYTRAGATTKEVMLAAGHSDPAVAMLYQHSQIERDREIANRMYTTRSTAPRNTASKAGGEKIDT